MFLIRNLITTILFSINLIFFSITVYAYISPFDITVSSDFWTIKLDSFVLYSGIFATIATITVVYYLGKLLNISKSLKIALLSIRLKLASRKKRIKT